MLLGASSCALLWALINRRTFSCSLARRCSLQGFYDHGELAAYQTLPLRLSIRLGMRSLLFRTFSLRFALLLCLRSVTLIEEVISVSVVSGSNLIFLTQRKGARRPQIESRGPSSLGVKRNGAEQKEGGVNDLVSFNT